MFILTDSELETYYANVLSVAHADRLLEASETAILAEIAKGLRIKKSQITAAEKTVAAQYQPRPVGTWVNQVDNLEAMVRVALADKSLSPEETTIVATFANAIGITQEQMDKLVDDVKLRISDAPSICPSCHAANQLGAKFCAQCGTPISSAPATPLDFTPPPTGIAIEFAESTAASFPAALEIANTAPIHQTCLRNRKTWYLAAWPDGTVKDTIPIANILNSLQNKGVLICGQKLAWEDVFGFLWCAQRRQEAYRPADYCMGLDGDVSAPNPWGCIMARMDWSEWADWFAYGQWEPEGKKYIWRFDKTHILHNVQTALHKFAYCPFLSPGLPEAFLSVLPDTVDPFHDSDWTYREVSPQTPGAMHLTIHKNEDGWSYTDEAYVLGVSPKTPNLLATFLKRARKKLG